MAAYPDMSTQLLRIIFDDWQRATAEPDGVTYRQTELGGVPGLWITPTGCDQQRVLVVMHGGGFALGSSASHRKMAGHMAKACGAAAFVADFRLAPEHPYPAAIEDGVAVLDALGAQGRAMSDITPVGDSAGGSVVIEMVLRLLAARRDLAREVITLSPWLNMENTGPTIETNNDTDFLITREGLQANIDRYLSGGASPTDPLVNPLYADLTGFPRLYICVSDSESLFDDSLRLRGLAEKCGVDVTLSIGRGQQHVYPIQAGRHAAADAEIAAIAAWYARGR